MIIEDIQDAVRHMFVSLFLTEM